MTTTFGFTWKFNEAGLNELLRGSNGGVMRDFNRRADAVVNGAKRRCPVNTGRLRASITKEVTIDKNAPVARIGTNVKYGIFIHSGTGIYGPTHAPIRPRTAKFLVFTPRGSHVRVFAKQVKGVKSHPFLVDALQDAKGP